MNRPYELSPEFDTLISEAERWPYVRQLFAGYLPPPAAPGSALVRAGAHVEQAWERMRREFNEATRPLRVSMVTETGTIMLGRTEEG